MFCPKCGNEVAEGSAFCGKCGNPLGQSSADVANSAISGAALNNASTDAAAPKKKKKRKIVAPVIIVLLVAVIGVAAAFATDGFGLLSDSDVESNDDIETSYSTEETEESEDSSESDESVEVKDSVEEYTWEELSAISDEIATASNEDDAIEIAKKYNLVNEDGTLDGTQTKSVTLTDGTVTSVQIAGFAHDDKSDGSGKAGITFIFTDAIAEMYMSDNIDVGWESSDMRSWLSSEGKALLPEELQDVLVAVDKSTNNVGVTEDVSSVTTTSDELWLFSYVELAGEIDESAFDEELEYLVAIYNAEGSQYKLFSDCSVSSDTSDSNDILAKTYQGESSYWLGRSPFPAESGYFMCVRPSGSFSYASGEHYSSISDPVVPGFCI